jgi:hypothetical protein
MKEDLLRALWPNGPRPNIWAIVDAAQDQRVYWTLTNSFLHHGCLFAGRLPEALEMAAPYLVQLDPDDKFTTYLAENMGRSLGIFLRCDTTLDDLRRHLRKFLTVKDMSGRKMLFRYYDPRVMRVYLPTCTATELQTVFGPMKAIWTEARDSRSLTQFEMKGKELRVTQQAIGGGQSEPGGDDLVPEVVPAQNVLVVPKSKGTRSRVPILLQGAGRGGRLLRSSGIVRVYRTATATEEVTFGAIGYTIPPSTLDPDVTIYAEGATPGEVVLSLETNRGGKAQKSLTVVAPRLETGGGEVCVGVMGESLGSRRRIDIPPAEPKSFKGRLILRTAPGGPALQLFTSERSTPGFDLSEGFSFDAPRETVSYWIEGEEPSKTLGDATLQLLVEDGTAAGDSCPVTAVRVHMAEAVVPGTPSRTGRWPVERHADTVTKAQLVLLTGVTEESRAIALRATTTPAGVKLRWSAQRKEDDGKAARQLSANPLPTLTANQNDAVLLSDATGTFSIHATAGATEGWGGPESELELVLVHAAMTANGSTVNGRFCACARILGTDQFRLHSGKDPAVRLEAEVRLTGGGPDGQRGVDSIYGGWINNIVSENAGARYKGGAIRRTTYNYGDSQVDFEAGPLLDATAGTRCLGSSEPKGQLSAGGESTVTVRAHMAPATQWKVHNEAALDKTIEQIWLYRDCKSYLTLWSADAPSQLGVVLQTGYSFTGDYTCNTTKTIRTTVPARLAPMGTVVFPALVPASQTELEAHPPVSGGSNVEES